MPRSPTAYGSAILAVLLSMWMSVAAGAPPVVPVTVENTPLQVQGTLTVGDNPARQPFQHAGLVSYNAGSLGGEATFTVPAGKRLVIEFVSFHITLPTGQKPTFNWVSVVNAIGNQNPISHYIPAFYQATGLFSGQMSDVFVGSSPTRLYADPGSTVALAVRREGSTGTGLASVSVSGYFVNLP